MSVEAFTDKILTGLQGQLKDQWDSFEAKDREIIERVAKRGAKLAAAEARGDSKYVAEHTEAFESMVKDLEAVAAIEAATFWNAVLDSGSTILITLAKKSLGLP